jgi:hypothetical protein
MADGQAIGLATLCMTQGLTLFQEFLPKFQEINAANPTEDSGMVQDVRMGELAAVLTTLGIGTMTSALSGSSVPAVVSAITAAALIFLYEYALSSRGVADAK